MLPQPMTLTAFVAYFRRLVAENMQLHSFVPGAQARIVRGGRSKLTYPLLWLEMPALQLLDKDGTGLSGKNECALLVLANLPNGATDEQEDALWESTQQLALQVLARMRRDRKNRLFSFDGNVLLEPVNTLTVANEIGWRFEFEMSGPAGVCYDAAQWDEITERG